MITLITGTPGSGKTLRAMYLIKEALAQGRQVYTDIDGVKLDGVTNVETDYDWRDSPEGSLVVFDEVQRRWPSTGKPGQAPQEDIRALETHRHTGHDIIVITQHPTLVHHHVRKLVGTHVHVRRASNAQVVTLFTLSEVFDPKDKGELRNTDKQTWRYPKNLFSEYKSATAHTHTFKLPAKLKFLAIFLLLLVGSLIYFFLTWDAPWSSSDQPTAQAGDEAEGPPAASVVSIPTPSRSPTMGGHLPPDLVSTLPPVDASRSTWDKLSDYLPGLGDGIYIAGSLSQGEEVRYLYRILTDGASRLVGPDWLFSAGYVVSFHDTCTHDLTHTLNPDVVHRVTCQPVRPPEPSEADPYATSPSPTSPSPEAPSLPPAAGPPPWRTITGDSVRF